MNLEKQIIKTYSRRQPVTRYESSAVLVPSYADPTHVRESRLNDKTLVVDNFDDTFDRLATGVVIPSPENSLDENGVAKEKDSVVFDIFKVPLQAKKNEKPKQKGKPKKKDTVSKLASVKRKKVNVNNSDSSLSDPEDTEKKQTVGKKSKEKVKKVVKKKKHLSLVQAVTNDGNDDAVCGNTDENVPNNSGIKETTQTADNFKKPKEHSDVNQRKIAQYFQASTPRVNRIQSNIDIQNISPVVMTTANDQTVLHLTAQEEQIDNPANNEQNANENANKNNEDNQGENKSETDNFIKPSELTKVHLLKTSKHLLTSTPRMNKIRMPVNLQHLSPIISDKERISGDNDEKLSTVDKDTENDQNQDVQSNVNDEIQVPTEPVVESVNLQKQHSESENSDSEESGEVLSQEQIAASQLGQQTLIEPDVINKTNNQDDTEDESTNSNNSSESVVDDQDDSLLPTAVVASNTNPSPAVNIDLCENTRSSTPSPLLFDDTEGVQNEISKSNVISDTDKGDAIQINFSQRIEDNKELANVENNHPEPPITKDKHFNATAESSYYPDEWTNDYDSTYGYDQHKKNLEKDNTADSQVDECDNKSSTSDDENIDNTRVQNPSVANEASNIDNTETESVKNQELERTESTLCDEDNAIADSQSQSDEQEEHQDDLSIPCEDNDDSMSVEEDDAQNSPIAMEEEQSYHEDECASPVDQPDENSSISDNKDSNDQSLSVSARPSKRRKTDVSEIMIFDKVGADDASEDNSENENDQSITEDISPAEDNVDENLSTESNDDVSLAKPDESEEIVRKLLDKELRIVLSRINCEEYKSSILSRKRKHSSKRIQKSPIKRKSIKRSSRKSKDADEEFVPRTKKQDTTRTSDVDRRTRRSITDDRIKHLFEKYQCKNFHIFAVRIEDEKADPTTRRSLKEKVRENSIFEDKEPDSSLTNGGLSEFLSKLNDPMKVTTRRKTQKRYDRNLAAINEDQAGQSSEDPVSKKVVTWGNEKRITFNDVEEEDDEMEDNDRISQPIFLKPGKSWARSLSIINHFHNGKNLDELAAGRENWRHSVQTVLNMQPEASGRSLSQNYEESGRESHDSRPSTIRESKSMRKSSVSTNSRFSIRIIPGGKRSTLTDDLMDLQRISHVSDRSRASRKTSLKIRRDTLIETEDDLIRSAKDIILKRCKQTSYEPFDVSFPDSYIDHCRKIGEGVYGEVFLYENGSVKSVIKIIPIEGDQLVNCEPQKKFHEILSEIIIAEELHKLRLEGEFQTNGFVEVNRIMCVIGRYPQKLIDLWYAYDEQKKSENDCPSMFEKDQLYIILELAHGGQDLEAYTFQNASESYAIFLQTALTLAVAEKSLEFEHRDLHWGNLLISKTQDKYSTYKIGSSEISLPTKGVQVTVIDFTLSRMAYKGCKIFNDLAADPTLFEAQGEYQFDIYRMMRDNVNDDWQQFNPFTNILWMDYTLDKMIAGVRYKKQTTKIHKSAIQDMKALRKEIMNYKSAFDFVTNCKKVQTLIDST